MHETLVLLNVGCKTTGVKTPAAVPGMQGVGRRRACDILGHPWYTYTRSGASAVKVATYVLGITLKDLPGTCHLAINRNALYSRRSNVILDTRKT